MPNHIEIKPNLSGFLSSFREIGYKLETAVSDVIDNSISANASTIKISMLPSAKTLVIFDDGTGMDKNTLVEAMRMGTLKDFRQSGDLGKFGLGLKTASFSQTKKFSVISKHKGSVSALQWDIDYMEIKQAWYAKELQESDIIPVINKINPDIVQNMMDIDSWTAVIWENMDKYSEKHLEELTTSVRDHLALVFHRYMSKEGYGGRKIKLIFNGTTIEQKNPFADNMLSTQRNPTETVMIKGHEIKITAYDVPNHNKLTAKQYQDLDMGDGFTKNQGFYLYREGRLLCWGTWFGLAKSCDATSLARIMIDTDNQQDELWNIDVKKSTAEPIPEVRAILKPYAEKVRDRSKTTKSHRPIKRGTDIDWWIEERRDEKTSFRINRQHPIFLALMKDSGELRLLIMEMLNEIEANLPIKSIDAVMNQEPHSISQTTNIDRESITETIKKLYAVPITKENILNMLVVCYVDHKEELEKLINEVLS